MGSVYTVSQVNNYIKNMFVRDGILSRISIKGEISECKYHSSGHIYFTLKDASAQLSCIMFSSSRASLDFRLEKGQSVIVTGAVSMYEKGGSISVNVREVSLYGSGALYLEFERLKKKLSSEGFFDDEHKKAVPAFVKTLGVVTASTGAALQDIINVTRRRNPYIQIVLSPAKVQGEGAERSVIKALKRLDKAGCDVIIVGRGGGSIEDLWAFNSEALVREVYELETPVVSAVGHQTDTTLIDLVSDLRAPTPSAAAELCTYEYSALASAFVDLHYDLAHAMRRHIDAAGEKLCGMERLLEYNNPRSRLYQKKLELDELDERLRELIYYELDNTKTGLGRVPDILSGAVRIRLERARHELMLRLEMLKRLSPAEKIADGFGYISKDGAAVKSVEQIAEGDELSLRLKDGSLVCQVKERTVQKIFEE